MRKIKPTVVYETYWYFAVERQNIFFRKLEGQFAPWTDDKILGTYKFTNAYRVADRVSQYLIRNVIYSGEQSPKEVFFRIILFKIFNRISTWQLLEKHFGVISWQQYSYKHYNSVLSQAQQKGERIYSGAYIMPSGKDSFGCSRKHSNHLKLLERMMQDNMAERICEAKSMMDAFKMLRSYAGLGDFLAYQYLIDINYSDIINFSEMDFVMAGPGAKEGINKCFKNSANLKDSEIIRWVTEHQEEEFNRRGLKFRTLWGRHLQLVDCQNLFCEVDKYARIAHPKIHGKSNRTQIKQKYHVVPATIQYWFPPKWRINEQARLSK